MRSLFMGLKRVYVRNLVMSSNVNSQQLSARPLPMESIILAQQLVLLPLYFFVPIWIAILNSIAAAAIWYSHRKTSFKVTRPLKLVITITAIIAIFIVFRKFSGKDAGIALISAMYGLKVLEINSRRDANLLLSLGFFMIVAGFLFSQKPLIAIYQFIPVLMILNAFIALNSIDRPSLFKSSFKNVMKDLGKYLVFALPIMIVLFLFFPRLSGPIWRMPGVSSAASGVSDTMSPGEISSLQLSDEIAFRVKFSDNKPADQALYWRMLVLDKFDGLAWSRSGAIPFSSPQQVSSEIDTFDYSITLEPTKLNYLVTLDRPVSLPKNGRMVKDYTTFTRFRIRDRIRYQLTSAPSLTIDPTLGNFHRTQYTRLPTDGNQRSLNWARQQRQLFNSDDEYLQALLRRINRQEYFYTLTPPIMDEDTIDSFWFDNQTGFCEHYSSAFVFMARAANIPARIVIGYQGAERNPLTDYLIVRHANAHAWTEVWLADRGWVRIDPTAAIAPHRVEQRLLGDYRQRLSLFDEIDIVDLDEIGLFKQLDYWFDQVNTSWNDWILDYNSQRQRQLFANWGMQGITNEQLVIIMIILICGFVGFISIRAFHQRGTIDPVEKAFANLVRKFVALQLIDDKQQLGPDDLLELLKAEDQSKYQRHIQALKNYIKVRYQTKNANGEQIKALVKQLKSL